MNAARKGFTLIELLIVVTIIAILSVIGIVSYVNFLKSARDAKRQSDLKFIQSALEQYFADQKYFPKQLNSGQTFSSPSGNKTYLSTVPSDPSSGGYLYEAYKCDSTNNYCSSAKTSCLTDETECNRYCLYARTENLNQTASFCPTQGEYSFSVTTP